MISYIVLYDLDYFYIGLQTVSYLVKEGTIHNKMNKLFLNPFSVTWFTKRL